MTVRTRREVSLEEPVDNWMYYADYFKEYGEPSINGKGHTRSQIDDLFNTI